MSRTALLALLILLALGALPARGAESLHVAFWNVENLFDTIDDPAVEGDEEFTPAGPKQWTKGRLGIKLNNLAWAIRKMNEEQGPDILGLCEVENRQAAQWLVEELASLGRDYRVIHQDSPSGRGIDCALIYDAAALTLRHAAFHFVEAGDTRDIVEAKMDCQGDALYVFVNHWPSRGNDESHRIRAAATLRGRLDEILALDARADIVVLGDLNDHPDNASVQTHLRAASAPAAAGDGAFYNTMWPAHEDPERGTYVYKNQWEVIDHIIVSPGLLDDRGFRWRRGSSGPVAFDFLLFKPSNRELIARPNRSYTGSLFHRTGYSDHLPVECVLER